MRSSFYLDRVCSCLHITRLKYPFQLNRQDRTVQLFSILTRVFLKENFDSDALEIEFMPKRRTFIYTAK